MSMFTCPIVTVKTVEPNPNADSLDILTFEEMAWVCQDVRGRRKVGDMVVYIPVDAMVDCLRPEFEFLKKNAKMRKVQSVMPVPEDGTVLESAEPRYEVRPIARIKTIRLRQVISQGLVIDVPFNLSITRPINPNGDADVAWFFGITKYEPPAEAVFSANAKGSFPDWCPKTDVERYQNVNWTVEPYAGELWTVSFKVDGTSLTVFYDSLRTGDEQGVCSRNQELKSLLDDPATPAEITKYGFAMDAYWKATLDNHLLDKVKSVCLGWGYERVAFQLELAGEGIQKNRMGLKGIKPFLFDIYVVMNNVGRYLPYSEMLKIAEVFKIETVPILFKSIRLTDYGNPPDFSFLSALKHPNGSPIEGGVFVCWTDDIVRGLGRVRFKYINPYYLLAEKDDE